MKSCQRGIILNKNNLYSFVFHSSASYYYYINYYHLKDKFAYLNDLEDLIDDDSDNGVNEEECQTLLALRQRVHDLVQQNDVAETTLRKLDEGIAECTRRLQETI